MESPSIFAELERRNVHRAALFYAGASWLLVQIATQVFPFYDLPAWTVRAVIAALAVGFPFAMLFSWFYEWTPQGIKRESEIVHSESITQQTGKKLDKAIIAVLTLAVIVLLADRFLLHRNSSSGSTEKSIAVLPLVNSSGDPANEYFSDGLSEELIAVLVKIPDLRIIGRSSSFQFKGKSDDSKSIGEKLGVAHLLEGSVRKQGDRVRIVAELINAADGRALWSETYDRELKDVFAVQSEIALAVTEQLKIKLLDAPARSDAAPSNDNLAAYDALQQGNFQLGLGNEAGNRKAIAFFEEAIRLDPRYALAYARLSTALRGLSGGYLRQPEKGQANARASEAARTAVSLAPDLMDARIVLGGTLIADDSDVSKGEAEYRKALALAPADALPHRVLGNLLMSQGRLTEAEALVREALKLDPLAGAAALNLAQILIGLGRYDEAEATLQALILRQPERSRPHAYLATLDLRRGRAAAALENAQGEPPGFWRDYALALAQQAQGDPAAADAALRKFTAENDDRGPFQVAAIYGLRKEPDKMFEWLDRAYTNGDPGLTLLFITPFLTDYRDDPRFAALCAKLNIALPVGTTRP